MTNKKDAEIMKQLEEAYKPSMFTPIFTTIICIAPYLFLLWEITEQKYDRLLFLALISAPLIAYMTFIWMNYFHKMKEFKHEVAIYQKDPDHYQW